MFSFSSIDGSKLNQSMVGIETRVRWDSGPSHCSARFARGLSVWLTPRVSKIRSLTKETRWKTKYRLWISYGHQRSNYNNMIEPDPRNTGEPNRNRLHLLFCLSQIIIITVIGRSARVQDRNRILEGYVGSTLRWQRIQSTRSRNAADIFRKNPYPLQVDSMYSDAPDIWATFDVNWGRQERGGVVLDQCS